MDLKNSQINTLKTCTGINISDKIYMKEIFKVYRETNSSWLRHRVYEVSNLGRVKCNGKIIEPRLHRKYLNAGSFPIHRAVAELFIPNPENKPFVDHIDTNTLNNRVDNLRWVTAKENRNNPLTIEHCKGCQNGQKRPNYKRGA